MFDEIGYNGLLRSNSRLSHISGPHFLHQTEHWLLQMGCTASYRLSNDHTWVCPKGAGHHRLVLKLRRDKTTHPEKSHWIYHQ